MNMGEKKLMQDRNESFVFYRSFMEALEDLPAEQYKAVMSALLHYGIDGEMPDDEDPVVQALFKLMKPQVDANVKRRNAGKAGAANRWGKSNGNPMADDDAKIANNSKPIANDSKPMASDGNSIATVCEPMPNANANANVNVNANVNDNSNSYINTIHTDEPRPAAGRECVKSDPPSKPPKEDPQKKKKSDVMEERFERFWSAYPKKVGKGDARKAFLKVNPSDALLGRMVTAVAAASASYQWQKNKGQFIPNPATWLNQQRWEDEVPPDMGRPDSRAAPQVKTRFSNFAEHEYTDEDEAVELELMRRGVLDGGN